MTTLREAAQQALEALEWHYHQGHSNTLGGLRLKIDEKALRNLRAALAQEQEQVEPVEPVDADAAYQRWLADTHAPALRRMDSQGAFAAGWKAAALAQQAEPQGCATEEDCTKQPWCRIRRECQRKQAEPDAYGYASYLAVAIWEKYYKDTAPHWKPLDDLVGVLTQIDNMTSGLTRLAQQAEPLNLSDRAVQRRLAAQWGYVPAAQAEPVEPVAWYQKRGQEVFTWPHPACWGQEDKPWTPLYAAPPQRKPLTEEEIESCRQKGYAHAGLGAPFDFGKAARAVERAHGIKE